MPASEGELDSVCAALDRAGVRWVQLRAPSQTATGHEIDLLVEPRDLARFGTVVAGQGFHRRRAWGRAPHTFFERAGWRLDVVTRLRYGRPVRTLEVRLAPDCLAARRRVGNGWVLTPEHEFVTLLLHALLDKPSVPSNYRARLLSLWRNLAAGGGRSRVASLLDVHAARALPMTWLAAALETNEAQSLETRRLELARRLFRRQPAAALARRVRASLLRRLDRWLPTAWVRPASLPGAASPRSALHPAGERPHGRA